jgi:uncharacterized protein with NAD-binding domain and iron-sulfur cluster
MGEIGMAKKVAILGGGIGALSAAFELTNTPDVEVTIYTLGWRLGGKCASSRGPDMRIEEHGIHGFCGSYFNALPMMAAVYAELDRPPTSPIPDFKTAFRPLDTVQLYYWSDGTPTAVPLTFPENKLFPDPSQPQGMLDLLTLISRVLAMLGDALALHAGIKLPTDVQKIIADMLNHVQGHLEGRVSLTVLEGLKASWHVVRDAMMAVGVTGNTLNTVILVDYAFTLIMGTITDKVVTLGWDRLDDENWDHWLARHGALPVTISSPMALNTVNLSYQYTMGNATTYPLGDTSKPSLMAAGAYVHWTLRSFAYCGHVLYAFAGGTGETIIAPLYEVLKKRGVKFEFFNKVEELVLSADGSAIDQVKIGIQATVKSDGEYQPLFNVKGLPSWPAQPFYDQLNEEDQLKGKDYDLESWWTPWQPVKPRTLQAGVDFDVVVFALSVGAVPYVASQLTAKSARWAAMVDGLPAVQTQAMQIWLTKSFEDLGWSIPLPPDGTPLADTWYPPFDGHAELRHLIPLEDWPANIMPKSLWYFCDCLPETEAPPPFTDTGYPARVKAKVEQNCIAYLNKAIGGLMPGAMLVGAEPGGQPQMNFGLLANTKPTALAGPLTFGSQFWRANIDPTERYVTSPPGSTRVRLVAWDTDFSNLVIAGDWAYTGVNVGSVECTVMSGKLASHAITGSPPLNDIPGYPANRHPLPPTA